jgi:tetratricopeptide (TPR) repeat protein
LDQFRSKLKLFIFIVPVAIALALGVLLAKLGARKAGARHEYDNGMRFLKCGDNANACESFTHAIEQDDTLTDAYVYRASTFLVKQDINAALSDLETALRLKPESSEAYAVRGNAFRQRKRFSEALSDCNHALMLDSRNTDALYFRGATYSDMCEWDKAMPDLNRTILQSPAFAPVYGYRAVAWYYKKDINKCIADCSKAIEIGPPIAWYYSTRANAYLDSADLKKAFPDCNEAIRLDSNCEHAYEVRAAIFWAEKKYHSSRIDYERVLAIQPSTARSWLNLARLDLMDSQYDKAVDGCNHALSLEVGNPEAFDLRAAAWSGLQEWEKSVADASKAINISPTIDAYFSRGWSNLQREQLDLAIQDYQDAVKLEPKNTYAHLSLGRALFYQGKNREALAELEIAATKQTIATLEHRAIIYFELGMSDKAIADLIVATQIEPEDVWGYLSRAYSWAYKGDFEKAAKDLAFFRSARPQEPHYDYDLACMMALQAKSRKKDDSRRMKDIDESFVHLEKALESFKGWGQLRWDPDLSVLREDPRFDILVAKRKPHK